MRRPESEAFNEAVEKRTSSSIGCGDRRSAKRSQVSQREFAKKLKRTNNFVWRIEAGERRVDMLEFIEIAKAANIEPSVLLERVVGG